MAILVTRGAGYIGSHTCMELLNAGYDVVAVDSLYNSSEKTLQRVEQITGRKVTPYEVDLPDQSAPKNVFDKENIESVIHFVGLKAVGESVHKPLKYYHNNITGTLILYDEVGNHGVKNIVFSPSATVYGDPVEIPITENYPKGEIISPYGRTKGMLEQILINLHTADDQWNVVLLRYLSPIGAHENSLIGEGPKGISNNLVPYIAQVAVGKLEHLDIFGNDYDTSDGTGVRDYIHVVDLVKGHVKTVKKLEDRKGVNIHNLGTGVGHNVLDVLHVYEKVCGQTLKYKIRPRRDGDVVVCYSDSTKAGRELGWRAEKGIEEMCTDSWRWQSTNPNGYRD